MQQGEKRYNFREYEERKIGNKCDAWSYLKDMQWCDCSESWSLCSQYTTVYYQGYEQFDNHGSSLAILNEINTESECTTPESECRGVHIVYGGILIEFENNGGICGIGVPSNEESDAGEGPCEVQGGRYQRFERLDGQRNSIYWYPIAGKAYAVTDLISDKYESLGGTWSDLGFPITGFNSSTNKQCFEKGYIEIVNGVAYDRSYDHQQCPRP